MSQQALIYYLRGFSLDATIPSAAAL